MVTLILTPAVVTARLGGVWASGAHLRSIWTILVAALAQSDWCFYQVSSGVLSPFCWNARRITVAAACPREERRR